MGERLDLDAEAADVLALLRAPVPPRRPLSMSDLGEMRRRAEAGRTAFAPVDVLELLDVHQLAQQLAVAYLGRGVPLLGSPARVLHDEVLRSGLVPSRGPKA